MISKIKSTVCIITALFLASVTLFAATNMQETDKKDCVNKATEIDRNFCCAEGCKKLNTAQQDISDCTKDCKDTPMG